MLPFVLFPPTMNAHLVPTLPARALYYPMAATSTNKCNYRLVNLYNFGPGKGERVYSHKITYTGDVTEF